MDLRPSTHLPSPSQSPLVLFLHPSETLGGTAHRQFSKFVSSFPSITLLLTWNTAFLLPPLSLYLFIHYFSFETQRKSPTPHVAFPNTPLTPGRGINSDTGHSAVAHRHHGTEGKRKGHRVHWILFPLVEHRICLGKNCKVLKDYSNPLLKTFICF